MSADAGPAATPPAQQVWLLRHGETEWSRDGRHTGRTDLPLTPAGEQAALALRPRLATRSFRLVLCSPLQRARRTCELAGLASYELDPDLCEWDYGEYEGRRTAEIRAERPGWLLWRDGCPDGESATEVGARADRVVAKAQAVGGDVALFAHGHLLRVLASRWIDLAPEAGALFHLSTATVSVLGYEREQPVFLSWNCAAR